jgi:hypothetical protein
MVLQLNKKPKFIAILVMVALSAGMVMAQESDSKARYAGITIRPFLGLVTNMNSEDFMLGVSFLPPLWSAGDLRCSASFWLRPYGKAVLSKYSENIYFVYKEEIYALLLGLDKELVLSRDLSLFGSAEAALVYKCYRGSDRDKVDLSIPVLTVGLGYGLLYNEANNQNLLLLRLGYQYCKMSIYPNRFFIALLVIM